ncbi:MAG: hypothetical protein ACP5PN_12215 [Steroidobacteraceae bacterium]
MCGSSARAHGPRPLRCRLRVTAIPRDLDLSAPDVLTAFELAAGGLEGIAQGHMGVFMSVIKRMAVADYDLLVRYVMSIGMSCSVSAAGAKLDWCRGAFGADPPAQNVGTEPLQMRREFADARAQPRWGIHLLAAHLHGKDHRLLPVARHANGMGRRPGGRGRRPQ